MMEHIEEIATEIAERWGFESRLTPRGAHLVVVIDGEDALRIPVASLEAVAVEDVVVEIANLAAWRARQFGMMH